jgi:hypothetical protein
MLESFYGMVARIAKLITSSSRTSTFVFHGGSQSWMELRAVPRHSIAVGNVVSASFVVDVAMSAAHTEAEPSIESCQ